MIRPVRLRWPVRRPRSRQVPQVPQVHATVRGGRRALPVRYQRTGARGWLAVVTYPGPVADLTVSVDEVPARSTVTVMVESA